MQVEERTTGSVAGSVYWQYIRAANGFQITVPVIVAFLVIFQAGQVLSQFDLTWWQQDLFNRSEAFYVSENSVPSAVSRADSPSYISWAYMAYSPSSPPLSPFGLAIWLSIWERRPLAPCTEQQLPAS